MASPLNRHAYGLLDFFGVKSGEWGPRELGQLLTPTLDLADWYLQPNAINVTGTLGGTPFGPLNPTFLEFTTTAPVDLTDGVSLTVPETEIWLVLEADMSWVLAAGAGGTAHFSLCSGPNLVLGPRQWRQRTIGYNTSVAAQSRKGSTVLDGPVWCMGGERIRVQVFGIDGVGAASVNTASQLRLIRFRR